MIRIALATGLALAAFGLTASPVLAQHAGARGGGPPFCQSGQGHPVHGWAWCVSKGWASAAHDPANLRGWDLTRWQDARFEHRQPVRYDDGFPLELSSARHARANTITSQDSRSRP
jgi:hypothetical protein